MEKKAERRAKELAKVEEQKTVSVGCRLHFHLPRVFLLSDLFTVETSDTSGDL